jgi:hypothetical protein
MKARSYVEIDDALTVWQLKDAGSEIISVSISFMHKLWR